MQCYFTTSVWKELLSCANFSCLAIESCLESESTEMRNILIYQVETLPENLLPSSPPLPLFISIFLALAPLRGFDIRDVSGHSGMRWTAQVLTASCHLHRGNWVNTRPSYKAHCFPPAGTFSFFTIYPTTAPNPAESTLDMHFNET